MSRKTNRLKRRVLVAQHAARKAEEKAARAAREAASLQRDLATEAALSIRIADTPAGVLRYGKQFRVDFVVDAFELDHLRRGRSINYLSVNDYARMIGRDIAEKVSRVIQEHISGRGHA